MNIIRDEDMFGLAMMALLHQWGINHCKIRDCNEEPTTIITGLAGRPFGLCEKHYNECVKNNFIKIENNERKNKSNTKAI